MKVFCGLAAVLLLFTGFGKIVAFLKPMPQYAGADPIFTFLTIRQLLLVGGLAELVLVALIVMLRPAQRKAVPIFWFSSSVLLYRAGFKLLGVTMPCHCLGYLARWSPLAPTETDSLMLALALALFAGSLLIVTGCLSARGSELIDVGNTSGSAN